MYHSIAAFTLRLAVLACVCAHSLTAQSIAPAPWPATDDLGRSLPTFEETGPAKKDRYVGIFYFICRIQDNFCTTQIEIMTEFIFDNDTINLCGFSRPQTTITVFYHHAFVRV